MEKFGLLTFVLILVLGVLSRQYVAHFTHVPYTVVMMLCGCVVGAVINRDQSNENGALNSGHLTSPTIRAWYNMDPEVLLFAFIPLLVFESAFMSDTHIFSRVIPQVLTLAGPGVLLASILTATFARFAFPAYGWSWPTCLMFGGILSATDPVAVVSLLKELGVSERLGTLIEGESLLNDGTAIVVFDVFFRAVEEDPCEPSMPSASTVVTLLFRLAALGPMVGVFVGWLTTTMLGTVLNDPLNEIAITVIACYGSFGLAEGVLGTSGILSVVLCGVYLSHYGRGRISADVEQAVHTFWSTISHIANTAVFFLAGLVMTVRVFRQSAKDSIGNDVCVKCGHHHESEFHDDQDHQGRRFLELTDEAEEETSCKSFRAFDFWYLVILYVALHVIRGIVVVVASPVLYRDVYGFDAKQASVVVYGGLRGAIGLALALIINETEGLEDKLKSRILFQVSGIALLTLLVNGTTTRHLLHFLGLDKSSDASDEIFAHVTVDVEKKLAKETGRLKREPFLGDANWAMVWRYVPCLSADAYWRRIKDHRLVLSEPELSDLGSASNHHHSEDKEEEERLQPQEAGCVVQGRRSKYWQYPVPPKLRGRWADYHRRYGSTPPKFLHLQQEATNDDDLEESLRHPIHASFASHVRNLNFSSSSSSRRRSKKKYPLDTFDEIFTAVGASFEDVRRERKKMQKFSLERAASKLASSSRSGGPRRDLDDDDDDEEEKEPEPQPKDGAPVPSSFASTTTAKPSPGGIGSRIFRPFLTKRTKSLPNVDDDDDVEADLQLFHRQGSALTTSTDDASADDIQALQCLDLALRAEARARIMYAVRANYNSAFARGRLGARGLRVLREIADFQLDETTKSLQGHWRRVADEYFSRVTTLERLRILKIYVPIPLVRRLFDRFIFARTAFVVEVAHNFVKALGDVDVNEVVDDGPDKEILVQEIRMQRKVAQDTVDEYAKIFPEVANAVKTQIAAGFILVRMQRLLQELHEHGALSETELEAASEKINVSRVKLSHHPTIELVAELETTLLKDLKVPFLREIPPDDLANLLVDKTQCRSEVVLAETIVAKKGKLKLERRGDLHSRRGWFVVARGALQATTDDDDDDNPDDAHESRRRRSTALGEVLGEGTICCLEEQLLGIPLTATLRALSMVHLVYFDAKAMLLIAERNDRLRHKLYWIAAARVLRESPGTAGMPETHIAHLEEEAIFVEVDDPDLVAAQHTAGGETSGTGTDARPRRASFRDLAATLSGSKTSAKPSGKPPTRRASSPPEGLVGKIHDLQLAAAQQDDHVPDGEPHRPGGEVHRPGSVVKHSPFCIEEEEEHEEQPAAGTLTTTTADDDEEKGGTTEPPAQAQAQAAATTSQRRVSIKSALPRASSSKGSLQKLGGGGGGGVEKTHPNDNNDEASSSANSLQALPTKKSDAYWSKLRGAVVTAGALVKEREKKVELLDTFKHGEDREVPPGHSLLLLRGTAFLMDRTDDQKPHVAFLGDDVDDDKKKHGSTHLVTDHGVVTHVVNAIAMIAIDDTRHTRTIRLSPGTKAFILRDECLSATPPM